MVGKLSKWKENEQTIKFTIGNKIIISGIITRQQNYHQHHHYDWSCKDQPQKRSNKTIKKMETINE